MTISTDLTPAERAVVDSVRIDDAWALVEEYSTLVRDAGSADERRAVGLLTERLDAWGIGYELHEPELLIGLPGPSALLVDGATVRAKTASLGAPSPPAGLTAPLTYEPGGTPSSVADLLGAARGGGEVEGRIVLIDGFPMAARIADLASRGAVGVVAVSPGERIHEMVCTPVWGSPDLASWGRRPTLPVLSISRSDGMRLIERAQDGDLEATLLAEQDTAWRRVPVLVAEVRGTLEPERFVLLHGHLDSWHVGVGDNATGDASLLEVARVLGEHRDELARSVRIAWWSGHSQGRYAGSTWYADQYALDLERNCICHVNCDSPGCRDAEVYEGVFWMDEAETFAARAVADFTGLPSNGQPPPRGGDVSFNNLGVSTFFMLTSTMPAALVAERGLYPVAGCGGNVEWHTEDDTLDIADPDNLLRDVRVYAGAVFRAANAPVHPLDFRPTLARIERILTARLEAVGRWVDMAPTFARIEALRSSLDDLYERAGAVGQESARPLNDALLEIGRRLVRILYSSAGPYRQDPAVHVPLLPEIVAAVEAIGEVPDGVVGTELRRACNRIDRALLDADEAARRALAATSSAPPVSQ